jgi:hypothetical protein
MMYKVAENPSLLSPRTVQAAPRAPMKALLIAAMVSAPTLARAQSAACADSTVHFEYQTSPPARWLPDSAVAVHPTPEVRNPPNLVQFVVDTLGVPQRSTFKVLKVSDSTIVLEARRSLAQWRFSPATLNGCRVKQLVQTPIGR